MKRLLTSDHDISVVVDIDWKGYYVNRKDHPLSEAENVIFGMFPRNNTTSRFVLTFKAITLRAECFQNGTNEMKWNPCQRCLRKVPQ